MVLFTLVAIKMGNRKVVSQTATLRESRKRSKRGAIRYCCPKSRYSKEVTTSDLSSTFRMKHLGKCDPHPYPPVRAGDIRAKQCFENGMD